MPGLGKIQRRIQRAFIANPGARADDRRSRALVLSAIGQAGRYEQAGIPFGDAAPTVAVKVGRTYPGGFIWIGKDSYQPPGDPSQSLPSDDDRE